MARNMYAKPTTTNASFIKVPVNLSSNGVTNLTWGQLAAKLPLLCKDGTLPIKAIKLGAITVGGSPDAPAHLEFKGGQTFDLPAMATKPMRVKASEKNLYVSGWRRISDDNGIKVSSNTDDDDLTDSVVFSYQGQVAYIEVAMRFTDDAGYRPWYQGDQPPSGDYTVYHLAVLGQKTIENKTRNVVYGYRIVLVYQDEPIVIVGERNLFVDRAAAIANRQSGDVIYQQQVTMDTTFNASYTGSPILTGVLDVNTMVGMASRYGEDEFAGYYVC